LVNRCKKDKKLARDKITQVPFPELWISQVGLNPFRSIGRSKVASIGLDSFVIIFELKGDNTLWGGAQKFCHVVLFLGVACLNFNHVIIMKDFHNVFAYYGKSKPK